MKLLWATKDGGSESRVWAYGLEIKGLFSVLLLKFGSGSREAFHSHAFNAVSWLLNGALSEEHYDGHVEVHFPGIAPVLTGRETFHKVDGVGNATWVLSFRGPWVDTWREFLPANRQSVVLTHGRQLLVA